jgi:hypothetical protein
MEERHHLDSMTCSEAQRDLMVGGLPVLRNLKGSLCAHCGSHRYVLVFRVSRDGRNGILGGRCSYCRNPLELAADEIERGCHA